MLHHVAKAAFSLCLLLAATACSSGGDDERPQSEILVSAGHQLFGFQGIPVFTSYPVVPAFIGSDRGQLILKDDSRYEIKRGNVTSSPQDYAIEKTNKFTIKVPVAGRTNPTNYLGAYSIDSKTVVYFFTDRFVPSATSGTGLFWGTQLVAGTPDAQGEWHLFTQHVIFSSSQIQDPDNVGRSVGGEITIAADGKVTGTGKESTKADLTFDGTSQGFADGSLTLTLDYIENKTKDTRIFQAGLSNDIILGLDEDESDGESGLIGLMRKRTGTGDPKALAGSYTVGLHTIFVNPIQAGIDAANGVLTFNDQGGWKLDGTGTKSGAPNNFTYSGTYVLSDNGALAIKVSGTNETWMGAVNQDYKQILVVDNFVETRTGTEPPELNIMLGIRESSGQTATPARIR